MRSLPRISVENPILVNLMMLAIIVSGAYCAMTLVREMFPESRPNQIMVLTPYPGASPAEVEKGISIKIEEQVKDIEGVEDVETTIREGSSSIMLSLYNEIDDVDRVVNDVKNAIDAIPRDDFPEEAEETIVSRFEPKLPVISVSWYGDMSDEQLKTMGKRLRDDILLLDGITDVVLSGAKRDEISVEIDPNRLVGYGLSFVDVTNAIARQNMDLPGGQVKTESANVSVRTLGERNTGDDLADLIVRADSSGQRVQLSDVATIVDGFEDVDLRSRIDGKPGVSVTVYKTADQDAVDIARKVKALVAGKNHEPFQVEWTEKLTGEAKVLHAIYDQAHADPYPPLGTLKTHSNLARFIEGRLDLLMRNGFWGLVFVFLSLLIFLNWRVAFWVMLGLLLAILGTLAAMSVAGITLNLISMFGLIVVLGMLVDDAIIVAEHTYTKVEEGEEPELAAITGAEEVTKPVTCAIATTVVAFAPLLFIQGTIGDFMGVLPVIVILSLSISLFEALTILPSHLAETFTKARRRELRRAAAGPGRFAGLRSRFRAVQTRVLDHWIRDPYERLLRTALSYRYVSIAVAVGILIISFGLIGGGIVDVVFLQNMDAETLIASLELPVGSPLDQTDAVMKRIEDASNGLPEMATRFTLVGSQVDMNGGANSSNAHLGQMIMELTPGEERERSSNEIIDQLRAATGAIPGVRTLTFRGVHGGPGGAAIQVEISGEDLDELVASTARVKDTLREFAGVFDIEDDFDAGQREVQVELLDSGEALGLTTESLAMQVRAAFYGLEARKIQRDREDVKIMVRYPMAYRRRIFDLEQMRVATPSGALAPITEVARITDGEGYATIRRKNQKRTVTVKADVNDAVTNPDRVVAQLAPLFSELSARYPGMQFELGGQSEERQKSFGSLGKDGAAAIILIFVILAALFKSYIQPLIVMAAIPFGVIGAIAGHWIMGYPMTIMSGIGLVALTGIVVNDSLILVDFINRRREEGVPRFESVIEGGRSRLRAIILTSITTVLGLAPLMAETSFQAKFLIPMAVSIAFGLAFATVLTLLIVPCLYMVVSDVRFSWRRFWRWAWPTDVPQSA